MRNYKHVFFSVAVHLVIISILIFTTTTNNKTFVDDQVITIETINPEFKNPKAKNGSSKKKSVLQKYSLFPKINFDRAYEQSEFPQASGLGRSLKLSDDRLFNDDIGDIFGEDNNQNWDFYKAIYHKIDQQLIFDSMLAQFKHFGRVQIQFTVTSLGFIDFKNIQIIAADPILKVHVLRALNRALAKPLEMNKQLKTNESIVIQSQFNFKFTDPSLNFEKQKNFGSKKFIFNRATLEKPIPEDLLEHLANGGVTPNISLMIERWQKYNRTQDWKKFQFDPFIDYKSDPFYDL